MRIDDNKCIACGACLPVCPMAAITLEDVAVIDHDECVDCGVCSRSGLCPVNAFVQDESEWPRSLRSVFSDPTSTHAQTGVPGRGTEEMKTNDVTGVFKPGSIGIALEFGRPGIGTRFHDVDLVAQAMAKEGAQFRPENPVTFLMEDTATGKLREDVLNEKVLSAIIEFTVPIENLKSVLAILPNVSQQVQTVFSVECINVVEPDGSVPMDKILEDMGIARYPNGKTCLGLGRRPVEGDN